MRIDLIQVPYHYGFLEARLGTGRGPLRYLEAGAERALRELGFEIFTRGVERNNVKEIPAAIRDANRALALQVADALAAGAFPLILSGPCSACLGVLGGLGSSLGIIWFDAHGDFNTPETTPSGFFDGMALAVATGLCWQDLWQQISDQPTVPPSQTLLIGVRDLDPGEQDNLAHSQVNVVSAADIKANGAAKALGPKLAALRSRVEEVYLHFDIDVLDPAVAPGVDFRSPNGLSLAEAEEAIHLVAGRFRVRAASLTAYNPDHDQNDCTLHAGLHLLTRLATAVSRREE